MSPLPGLADSKLSVGPLDIARTFSPGLSALRHSGSMSDVVALEGSTAAEVIG